MRPEVQVLPGPLSRTFVGRLHSIHGLPPGVPVLDVLHTSLDQQGQPYELTRFVMRADLSGLLYDVPVE
jgi:hypothetical protein